MKMYNAIKTGLKVGAAGVLIYVASHLPGCAVQKVQSPKDYITASTKQMQTYAADKKFNAHEMRELASTYLRIEDLLESGVKDEAKKKELEARRGLLGQIIDYVFENAETEAIAYVAGVNSEGKVKNNPRLETGLSGKVLDAEVTADKDKKAKTRKRLEYLLRIQSEAVDVMNMHGTDVDNEAWHNTYVEESAETAGNLISMKGKFGAWTELMHKRYTDGLKENGELILYGFGVVLKEAVKVPAELAEAIKALTPKKDDTKVDDLAELERLAEKEAKEAEAAKKRLEEAKADKEAKEKAEKEAKDKAEKEAKEKDAAGKDKPK